MVGNPQIKEIILNNVSFFLHFWVNMDKKAKNKKPIVPSFNNNK
tara:strand:+ start:351 stop:482 length:132 start_codon:yes stop_codon:yes gene_type:complete